MKSLTDDLIVTCDEVMDAVATLKVLNFKGIIFHDFPDF